MLGFTEEQEIPIIIADFDPFQCLCWTLNLTNTILGFSTWYTDTRPPYVKRLVAEFE
jgi:hypothetical protein